MTAAAFKGTYSDWKPVKTRRVIQIVFEVPWELHDAAYQALGGMPDPAKERWFGIARLVEGGDAPATGLSHSTTDTQPRPVSVSTAQAGARSPAQIAGYLCTLPAFQKFLSEKYSDEWVDAIYQHDEASSDEEVAADCVRVLCKVSSRSGITKDNAEWSALLLAFKLWEKEPEVVG